MNNQQKLEAWFNRFNHRMDVEVPEAVARIANEHFKKSFTTKSFAGSIWAPTKKVNKMGSLMKRTGALYESIRIASVSSTLVRISAGNNAVKYARIHNEGGTIDRQARKENFVRNRHTTGKKGKMFGGMGAFRKGTTPGGGLSFKAYKINMPRRQFMGHSAELNKLIITQLKQIFKNR